MRMPKILFYKCINSGGGSTRECFAQCCEKYDKWINIMLSVLKLHKGNIDLKYLFNNIFSF